MTDLQVRKTLLHGTSALGAVSILADGFRLLPTELRPWGRGYLGDGIYVTASPQTAFWFSDEDRYLLRVRLAPGIRILPIDRPPEPRVVASLRREFGKDILTPEFARAMPPNKRLTRRELASLLSWVWARRWRRGGDFYEREVASFHRHLRRYGYDGLGCRTSDLGIVVFNPSRVLPLEALRFERPGTDDFEKAGGLVVSNPSELAACAAKSFLRELKEAARQARTAKGAVEGIGKGEANAKHGRSRDGGEAAEGGLARCAAFVREAGGWRRALERHCARHGIPTDREPLRSALETRLDLSRAAV